jgi:uncharacterized membrane protein (UPF0127 family)
MEDLKIREAKSFKDKLLGFMFKKSADHAILFEKCAAVHTCFMRFNIDVVFMDKDKNIIKEVKNLKPWRIAFCRKAYYVLEIPSQEKNN